jgi:hypothetical protein
LPVVVPSGGREVVAFLVQFAVFRVFVRRRLQPMTP